MPPPPDVVKVAVEWPGANAQLLEFDQKRPLVSIIKEVCDGWSLPNPEYYTLRYADGAQLYITEQTRGDIKNGTILQLAVSPSRAARQLMDRTQSPSLEARLEAMKELAKLSADVTFATEFINMDGISVLTRLVESSSKFLSHYGEMLAFTLTAFLELMDHGLVSWDTVSVSFIKQIAGYVSQPTVDVSILQRSLAILESMVLNSQALYQKIADEITVGQLLSHLQVSNQEIQTYAIALINALFLKAPEDKRQEMANAFAQKQLRSVIFLHKRKRNSCGRELLQSALTPDRQGPPSLARTRAPSRAAQRPVFLPAGGGGEGGRKTPPNPTFLPSAPHLPVSSAVYTRRRGSPPVSGTETSHDGVFFLNRRFGKRGRAPSPTSEPAHIPKRT